MWRSPARAAGFISASRKAACCTGRCATAWLALPEEIPPQLCKVIQPELRAYEAPLRSTKVGGTGWRANEPRYGYSARYEAATKADAQVPQAMRAKIEYPFKIGQNVSHAKFGAGVVISFEGIGPDARVMVNFKHAGAKLLALEYAKLEAV